MFKSNNSVQLVQQPSLKTIISRPPKSSGPDLFAEADLTSKKVTKLQIDDITGLITVRDIVL